MKLNSFALLGALRRLCALFFFLLAASTLAPAQAAPGITRAAAEAIFWKKDGSAQSGSLNLQAATNSQSSLVVRRLSGSQTGDVFSVRLEDNTQLIRVTPAARIEVSTLFRFGQRVLLGSQNVVSGGTVSASGGMVVRYTSTTPGGTFNFPTGPQDDQILIVQDVGGVMGTNPVTINAGTNPLNIEGASTYQLNVSKGCWAFRYHSGGTWSLLWGPAGSTVPVAVEGAHYFRQLPTAFADATLSNSGTVRSIAFVGDSWTQDRYITSPLRDALRAVWGNGGAGFMNWYHNGGLPDGVALTLGGTWTGVDGSGSTAALGADGSHVVSTGITCTATVDNTDDTTIRIHYVKQSGGGQFRWRVNAGSWTTVDTSNASTDFGVVVVSGLDGTDDDVSIEVTSQGTNGVILSGVVGLRSSGVVVHSIGNGGATAADYNALNWTVVGAALADLQPDAVTILVGSNEANEDISPSSFSTSLSLFVDNVRTATAGLYYRPDVGLIFPSDNGRSTLYTMAQYESAFVSTARLKLCPSLSLLKALGPYDADATHGWVAKGFYYNNIHPSTAAGKVIAWNIRVYWPPFGGNLFSEILAAPEVAILHGPGFAI